MSEIDGVGNLVTGTLVADAVEPDTGTVAGGWTPGTHCLNCRAPLTGPYCNQCGQKARVHRSLRAYFGDFAASLFNFEGKFWHTLPMLAWKPGELTRRYVEGERAHFISPIALYLFTVFAMFAALNFNGTLDSDMGTSVETNLKKAVTAQQAEVAELEAKEKKQIADKEDPTEVRADLTKAREELAELEKVTANGMVTVDDGDIDEAPPIIRDAVLKAKENPDAVVTNITDAASKYSWLLIPISVPFLWLLFPLRRRHRMFDHAVFVTYSLSFMMILAIVAALLVWGNMPGLASLLFFVPPVHMYRQLRGAYQLGRWSALLRTFALTIFATIAVSLFAVTIVGLGLLG